MSLCEYLLKERIPLNLPLLSHMSEHTLRPHLASASPLNTNTKTGRLLVLLHSFVLLFLLLSHFAIYTPLHSFSLTLHTSVLLFLSSTFLSYLASAIAF